MGGVGLFHYMKKLVKIGYYNIRTKNTCVFTDHVMKIMSFRIDKSKKIKK